jgi:predicted polyphosphate/ATP-dependent NAD kinase
VNAEARGRKTSCLAQLLFSCYLCRYPGVMISRRKRWYTWSKRSDPTIWKKKEAKSRTKPMARAKARQKEGTTYVHGSLVRELSIGTQLILGAIFSMHRRNFHSLKRVARERSTTTTTTNNKSNIVIIITLIILMVSSLGRDLHKADGMVVTVVLRSM